MYTTNYHHLPGYDTGSHNENEDKNPIIEQEENTEEKAIILGESRKVTIYDEFNEYFQSEEYMEIKVDKIIKKLPAIFQDVLAPLTDPEEQLMMMSSLVVLTGALMPSAYFIYDKRETYLMLMLMVTAPPSSGKGVLAYLRKLFLPIDLELINKRTENIAIQKAEKAGFKQRQASGARSSQLPLPPLPPTFSNLSPMFFVPGNVTSAALASQLMSNGPDNALAIFELEADAFGISSNSGGFGALNSTILRSMFQNEPVSQLRKTNNEHTVATCPKGVVVFSGTENQILKIFKSNSDGLFSRFMFINATGSVGWRNGFSNDGFSIDKHFESLSPKFLEMWQTLRTKKIEVKFTEAQQNDCNKFGRENYAQTHNFISDYANSIPKRHAGMLLRIAAIICIVRHHEKNNISDVIFCNDADFKVALWLIEISHQNAIALFKRLPGERIDSATYARTMFWNDLPNICTPELLRQLRSKHKLSETTYFRWMRDFRKTGLLLQIEKGIYQKINLN